jgi:hypothetical protein
MAATSVCRASLAAGSLLGQVENCTPHASRQSSSEFLIHSHYSQKLLTRQRFECNAAGVLPSLSSAFNGVGSKALSQATTRHRASVSQARHRNGAVTPSASRKVLLVNTHSGGHAVIGFWLAKQLQNEGHQVTLYIAGDASSEILLTVFQTASISRTV